MPDWWELVARVSFAESRLTHQAMSVRAKLFSASQSVSSIISTSLVFATVGLDNTYIVLCY